MDAPREGRNGDSGAEGSGRLRAAAGSAPPSPTVSAPASLQSSSSSDDDDDDAAAGEAPAPRSLPNSVSACPFRVPTVILVPRSTDTLSVTLTMMPTPSPDPTRTTTLPLTWANLRQRCRAYKTASGCHAQPLFLHFGIRGYPNCDADYELRAPHLDSTLVM